MEPAFDFTSRVRPIIEIGIGNSNIAGQVALWDVAQWDDPDAVWSGIEPNWFDVSCWGISIDGKCGRGRNTDRFEVGEFTIVLNNATGWADPLSEDGPGNLTLRPGRQVRYGVVHAELGTIWLQRGWLDEVEPLYVPDVDADTVVLRCIDALGEVGRAKIAKLEEPVGAGEFAHERFARILDAAPWSSERYRADESSVEMIATTLGGQVADLLGQVADSIGGVVFGDVDGYVSMRGGDWQAYGTAEAPDGVIGNTPDVYHRVTVDGEQRLTEDGAERIGEENVPIVCPLAWVRPFDRKALTTRVVFGRDDDDETEPIVHDDVPAQVAYGIEPLERLDLLTVSDTHLDALALRTLEARSAGSMPRVSGVTLDASRGDDVVDLMATLDPTRPTRLRCLLVRDRGTVFDADHFVVGWSLSMSADEWLMDVRLDLAAPFARGLFAARWDVAMWDAAYWSAA